MFRKIVSVVLTVVFLSPTGVSIAQGKQNEKSLTEQMKEKPKTFTYKDGLFEGAQQANEKGLGRGGTGFVVGFFTGFVGTGIGYAIIGNSSKWAFHYHHICTNCHNARLRKNALGACAPELI